MTQINVGDTVTIHYTGSLADGTVFNSSRGGEPLVFTMEKEQVIPGFEHAVLGMQLGQSKQLTISADKAYGGRRDDLVFKVDRAQLAPALDPTVGEHYQIRQPDGQVIMVTVQEVSAGDATLNANHPLAGKDLTFAIELLEIA